MSGAAQAATLSGLFNVKAVNVTNVNRTQSEATRANFDDARAGTLSGPNGVHTSFDFTYDGPLDFATSAGNATTIAGWLATGVSKGGILGPLAASIGGLTLSKGNIDAQNGGTATSTFFLFEAAFPIGSSVFDVRHDDGMVIFENGDLLGGFVGPTVAVDTMVAGFTGGSKFELLYVATNSDPSILKVDVQPVPLPAPLALLVTGLASLGFMRFRRKAA